MKKIILVALVVLITTSCTTEKHYNEWVVKNNDRYYYDINGSMIKNQEIQIEGYIYYFDNAGKMKRGIQEVDGKKKYYGTGGHLVNRSQWVKEGNDYYYFDYNGEMVTGWTQDEHLDYWYYLKSDGKMAKSQWVDGNYYVDENGRMLKSADKNLQPVLIDNKKYYVDNDGLIIDEDKYEIVIKNTYSYKYKSKYATEYANYEYSVDKLYRDGNILDAKTKLEQYKKLVDKNDYDMIENITMSNLSKYEAIVNDDNKAYQFIEEYKRKLGY